MHELGEGGDSFEVRWFAWSNNLTHVRHSLQPTEQDKALTANGDEVISSEQGSEASTRGQSFDKWSCRQSPEENNGSCRNAVEVSLVRLLLITLVNQAL